MKSYIKKNIEVQSIEYTGDMTAIFDLAENYGLKYKVDDNSVIQIETTKGFKIVDIGDFILLSDTGDFEAVSHDFFINHYFEKQDASEIEEENSTPEDTPILESKKKQSCVRSYFLEYFILFTIYIAFLIPFIITNVNYKKNISTVIQTVYQEEINKESKVLLEKTQVEAEQIIMQAKLDAIEEANQAFKNEMERLTNERIRK